MLSYFEVPENLEELAPNVAELWNTYLEKDEKYRNDRLKMIARVPEISFFLLYKHFLNRMVLGL